MSDIAHATIRWKDRVTPSLQDNLPRLYNYLAYQMIRWLANRRRAFTCDVILDKSIYGFQQLDINSYIESDGYRVMQREWGGDLYLVPRKLNVRLSHQDSRAEAGLQIADFVAGSIFHYWDSNGEDDHYYRHIRNRVCGEYLFPKPRV